MEKYTGIILGVDPGTSVTGVAIIGISKKKIYLLKIGVINLKKEKNHQEKLQSIFESLHKIIDTYSPSQLAIETPIYNKNAQAMLKLGRAQGVAIAAGMTKGLSITEYAPKSIKRAITGNGNASKEQVAAMLPHLIKNTFDSPLYLDASDALAIAICHYYQQGSTGEQKKRYSDWKSYLTDNPKKKA